MGNIYRFADYQPSLSEPVREGPDYWRAREEAVDLIKALQRLGDELADLEDILEQGSRHPSYSTWEGDLESFLHVAEYSRGVCRNQIEAVRDRARVNLFVIETLHALKSWDTVCSQGAAKADGRNDGLEPRGGQGNSG